MTITELYVSALSVALLDVYPWIVSSAAGWKSKCGERSWRLVERGVKGAARGRCAEGQPLGTGCTRQGKARQVIAHVTRRCITCLTVRVAIVVQPFTTSPAPSFPAASLPAFGMTSVCGVPTPLRRAQRLRVFLS